MNTLYLVSAIICLLHLIPLLQCLDYTARGGFDDVLGGGQAKQDTPAVQFKCHLTIQTEKEADLRQV